MGKRNLKLRKRKAFPSPNDTNLITRARPIEDEIILIHGNAPQRSDQFPTSR